MARSSAASCPRGPQRLARRTGVDLGGRGRPERLEIERQPAVGRHPLQIAPRVQLDDPLAAAQHPDQVLLVPAGEDHQLARGVVHAGAHHRGVPLPAILADDRRVGLHRIFVEVVEQEAVHAVARERPLATHRQQATLAAHNLHLIGRADVVGGLRAALDRRRRKEPAVFGRLQNALHAAVELRGQRRRIGGDGDAQIGVEPQQIGRQQRRGSDALAVLGRHGNHQAADAPVGEGFEHAVIGAVEPLQLQKRIDCECIIGEGGHGREIEIENLRILPPRPGIARQCRHQRGTKCGSVRKTAAPTGCRSR